MDLLIGCDPEVFVTRNGVPFSAYGMVPGTKAKPFEVDNGAVQVDGMALEFNTKPAATSKEFVHNVQSVFKKLESMIQADCRIEVTPSIEFDWDHIKDQPQEALELGCDPDYNAYTGFPNPRPDGKTNLRTASGHVHIGWTKDADITDPVHVQMCFELVRQLDFFLGIPSVILDKDKRRRSMYGQAGSCRIKKYGVEYRVLSNFWLKDPAIMEWVFKQTVKAVEELGKHGTDIHRHYGVDCRDIINNSDERALKRFKAYKPYVWSLIDTFDHLIKR